MRVRSQCPRGGRAPGRAVQHVLQGNTAPGIQRTGSLWPVELVAGKAEQVNVRGLHINGQVPGSLYSVSVEQRAVLPAEAPSSAMGCTVPISLLANMMLTRQVSGCKASASCCGVIARRRSAAARLQ